MYATATKRTAQLFAASKTRFLHTARGGVEVTQGELFVNANNHVTVKTENTSVHVHKGGLASVKVANGLFR